MIRSFLSLVIAGALMGCASSSAPLSKAPGSTERTRLAAYAASANYPRDTKTSGDVKLAATLDASNDNLTLRNFSDSQLRNVRIWVNSDYVRQIDVIPAYGAVTINKAQFYNGSGMNLADQNVSIRTVQVQDDDKLYSVSGPQME